MSTGLKPGDAVAHTATPGLLGTVRAILDDELATVAWATGPTGARSVYLELIRPVTQAERAQLKAAAQRATRDAARRRDTGAVGKHTETPTWQPHLGLPIPPGHAACHLCPPDPDGTPAHVPLTPADRRNPDLPSQHYLLTHYRPR